ncbi:hypothetical protein BDN70DRAFT_902084, partial [Pholiota conissans]
PRVLYATYAIHVFTTKKILSSRARCACQTIYSPPPCCQRNGPVHTPVSPPWWRRLSVERVGSISTTNDAAARHPPNGRTDALPPIGKLEVNSLHLGGPGNSASRKMERREGANADADECEWCTKEYERGGGSTSLIFFRGSHVMSPRRYGRREGTAGESG